MIKRSKLWTVNFQFPNSNPCSSKDHLVMARSRGSARTSTRILTHFYDCPVHTQSSHVQQCGFYEWDHELQWRGANDSSWILQDRSNHCHFQHHDRYYVLDIYKGFKLWVYLYPVPILYRFHQCSRYSRNPRFGRMYRHSIRFVLWIECDWYHSKLSRDSVYSSLVRSSDLKSLIKTTIHSHNDHGWSWNQWYQYCKRNMYTDNLSIWSIDICVQGYEW